MVLNSLNLYIIYILNLIFWWLKNPREYEYMYKYILSAIKLPSKVNMTMTTASQTSVELQERVLTILHFIFYYLAFIVISTTVFFKFLFHWNTKLMLLCLFISNTPYITLLCFLEKYFYFCFLHFQRVANKQEFVLY